MRPISNLLALLILFSPVSILVSVFGVGFYLYRSSFDASAFSTTVSSLLSSILVVLLVWERLRDSLFNKLEYLHRSFLFNLYTEFAAGNLLVPQDKIEKLRIELKRYGKFLVFSLYPRGLLRKIDDFLSVHKEFYELWTQITKTAKITIPQDSYSENDLLQFIGIKSYRPKFPEAWQKEYELAKQTISGVRPELIPETKVYFEKMEKLKEEIFVQVKDFLIINNLRIEPSFDQWH